MVDSYARVTGGIDYALNYELPRMLHARILRSPYPHARLVKIETAKAERFPGVAAVLSRKDLLGQNQIEPYHGQVHRDQTPVALDKVRFVGDAVAAVAAEDETIAAEALDLIEVEYEEIPAVFDPEEALGPGRRSFMKGHVGSIRIDSMSRRDRSKEPTSSTCSSNAKAISSEVSASLTWSSRTPISPRPSSMWLWNRTLC